VHACVSSLDRGTGSAGMFGIRGAIWAIFFAPCVVAFYSINFVADEGNTGVVNAGASFLSAPSAEHVADIYARLSGHAPLFSTDSEKLPTLDVLAKSKAQQPLLLEVHGGSEYFCFHRITGKMVPNPLFTIYVPSPDRASSGRYTSSEI